MKKRGGLFVRGDGFSAEQIAGYERDAKRLADWKAGKRPTKEEDAAAIARAEARERDFQEWDKKFQEWDKKIKTQWMKLSAALRDKPHG